MMHRRYDPRGLLPQYDDPGETRAYLEGYEDGFFNFPPEENHPLVNAYSKGYWNGFHDDGEAFAESLKER
jgi:hypothetical protein